MRAQLVALNCRFRRADGQSAEPLIADVIVALRKRQPVLVVAIVVVSKMKEQPHKKSLPDRARLAHQRMIEASKVVVLE